MKEENSTERMTSCMFITWLLSCVSDHNLIISYLRDVVKWPLFHWIIFFPAVCSLQLLILPLHFKRRPYKGNSPMVQMLLPLLDLSLNFFLSWENLEKSPIAHKRENSRRPFVPFSSYQLTKVFCCKILGLHTLEDFEVCRKISSSHFHPLL